MPDIGELQKYTKHQGLKCTDNIKNNLIIKWLQWNEAAV